MPTRWIASGVALLGAAGCIGLLGTTERYTCRDDGDCDKGASEECRGVEIAVDPRCADPPEEDGPFYLSEAGQETCVLFYCAPEGKGTICGENNCVEARGCVAKLDDQGEVVLDCEDLATLDAAPTCGGLDDTGCPDNRCVRYLDWKLSNSASEDPGYRCLP